MVKDVIYFDNAASTQVAGPVIEAMSSCMRDYPGNPSSTHEAGRKARIMLENARRSVASALHALPSEIFFTSGGTEANNAILWGCCKDLHRQIFITSRLEHPAVLNTLDALVRYMGVGLKYVNFDALGHADLNHLESLLKEHRGAVVALMHANNETGNLLPVKTVAELCMKYDALFHSDMVQTIGKFNISLPAHQIDFAAGSAHKFHGPKGVGFIYVAKGRSFKPFLTGGGQERGMRAGTENLCGIIGLARALEWSLKSLDHSMLHVQSLKEYLIKALREEIPGTRFNGDIGKHSLYSILNFTLPEGKGSGMLLPLLDMAGICVSSGSACASGASLESHVLAALNVDPNDPSVRVSFSRHNTLDEVKRFVDVLKSL